MDFFRSDDLHEELTADDCAEIFASILPGSSDFTPEFLREVAANYGVDIDALFSQKERLKPPKAINPTKSKYLIKVFAEAPNYVFNVEAKNKDEALAKAIDLANETYDSFMEFYDGEWQTKILRE